MILKKKPALMLTLGAAVALIVGGGIAYWFLTNRRSVGREVPIGAEVIPQTALMTLSFSTDEAQWEQLQQLGTDETQSTLRTTLSDWRDRLLTANGYTFRDDIQPWVGDRVMVAFLSPDSLASTAESDQAGESELTPVPAVEQPMIWVLPIADPLQAQQTLTEAEGVGDQATQRDYKGLEIREFSGQSDQTFAATVIDRQFLVVANAPAAVEQVIDTYRDQTSVAEGPGFRQAWRQIYEAQPFLQAYINVPVASQVASTNADQSLPAQGLVPLRNNQGFAAAVILDDGSVNIHSIAWLHPDRITSTSLTNTARQMPDFLPASTLVMASGGSLQQLWQRYSESNDVASGGPFSPENLSTGVQATTGLDLNEDLMAWMNGEFAIALVPTSDQPTEQNGVGALFLVQASDRNQAEQTLTELDTVMQTRFRFEVNDAQINNQTVTQWNQPISGLTLTRGWLDNDVIFITFGSQPDALLSQMTSPLAENELFQDATRLGLTPNNGYFFINLEQINTTHQTIPLPDFSPTNQAFIDAIRAIGITAAVQNEYSTRYDISVLLEQQDHPPSTE